MSGMVKMTRQLDEERNKYYVGKEQKVPAVETMVVVDFGHWMRYLVFFLLSIDSLFPWRPAIGKNQQ